jgi:ABC-type transport system substrate-binding protein
MRLTKWIFFAYLAVVAMVIAAVAAPFLAGRQDRRRDPATLYSAYAENIRGLDPAAINDTTSSAVAGNIFECLYNYSYGVKPYTLFPQVASQMPTISDDGKVWTIPLRNGIRFYDPNKEVFADGVGPEVKAQDYVYSWKRIANFHLGNTANYSAIFQGRVLGLDDWWDYTKSRGAAAEIDWDRPVAGLTALDDHTIRITLTQPYPQLIYNLAHLPTAAVSRRAVEKLGEKLRQRPIGTGPYVLKEHLEEQRIILEANPIYRGRPDIDGGVALKPEERLPKIKRMQIEYFAEPVPRWLRFRQGLLDVSGIPREAYNQAISPKTGNLTDDMRNDGVVLVKSPDPSVYYTGFNMLDPVVGRNKPLRQAVSMAFNRQRFIRDYLNGRGIPAIGPIPPGFPTYDPNKVNSYTQYDLARARRMMQEAERIHGGPIPPLALLMPGTDTAERQMAEFVVAQMAQIGLTIKPEFRTWARFQEMVDDKQTQLFELGWVADYPDEQTFFQLFYSKNTDRGGVNSAGYSNPRFDALYEQAVVMTPGPQRDLLYRRMSDIVEEDCPWVIEYYPLVYTLTYDWVGNLRNMDYGNAMRMYVTLDAPTRQRWLESH